MSGSNESPTTRSDLVSGLVILGIFAGICVLLFLRSIPAMHHTGLSFLWQTEWSTQRDIYGALPYISGTVMTSAFAIVLAGPVSIAVAVLLTQYTSGWIREAFVFLVELVAGIPSVIYGLWGLLFFENVVTNYVTPAIQATPLSVTPFFGSVGASTNMLLGSLVLSLMITPIVSSFSRESLVRVPQDQRDAGIALGLTRWEVITGVILPYARAGIISAIILGLGRAVGETMAVTMLLGNTPQVTANYFNPAETMSALLANSFEQTSNPIATSAYFELGLVLFAVAFIINAFARGIIEYVAHEGSQ